MNENSRRQHGNEGPESVPRQSAPETAPDPYWKRAHRSVWFWVGLILMLAAITIYVVSDDLSLLPRGGPRRSPPATAGK